MNGGECDSFCGIQARAFSRYYKVYLTKNQANLAWLAGEVYDDYSARLIASSGQIFMPLLLLYFRRLQKRRLEREQFYDCMDVASEEFLKSDRRNLRFTTRNLATIELLKRRGASKIKAGRPTSGVVTFTDSRGAKLKLILTDQQDLSQIEQSLRNSFGSVVRIDT